MGGAMASTRKVPSLDQRSVEIMERVGLGMREIAVLWRHFRRGDTKLTGTIDAETFFRIFREKRNVFGDGLFELLNIEDDLDFGKYLLAVTTYCLFEQAEILRFCFFVFDADKTGCIDREDLELILKIFYHGQLDGNVKVALKKLDFHRDNKIDFSEFEAFHAQFPALFYPAFRLQQSFVALTLGQRWWDRRKRQLHEEREMIDRFDEEHRGGRKKGYYYYYCCCCCRGKRKLAPAVVDEKPKERKRKPKRKKQELETPEWHAYLKAKPLQSKPIERRPLRERAKRAQARRQQKIAYATADAP